LRGVCGKQRAQRAPDVRLGARLEYRVVPPQRAFFVDFLPVVVVVVIVIVGSGCQMPMGQRKVERDGDGAEEGVDVSCCEVLSTTESSWRVIR
jgi:hypothetical protein